MDVFSCFFWFHGSTSRKITQAMASDFSALLLENPHKKKQLLHQGGACYPAGPKIFCKQVESKTGGKVINREV